MANARFKLKYGASPVDMALSLISKTRVNKSGFTRLLIDILEGVVLIHFANDPRTTTGVNAMVVLNRYLEFPEAETAGVASWWKMHGRHAAQLVQQAYLNDRLMPAAAPDSALVLCNDSGSPLFSPRAPSFPFASSDRLGVAGPIRQDNVAGHSSSSDVTVWHLPTVATSSHPVWHDLVGEEGDMRQIVRQLVSNTPTRLVKGTSRAVRELGRQAFGPRAACVIEFGAGIKMYRKLKRGGSSSTGMAPPGASVHAGLCDPSVLDCFAAVEVVAGYVPPFDRNDLMLTNRAGVDSATGQPVVLVKLVCGSMPLYITWCVASEVAVFKESVCSGAVICNELVTAVRFNITLVEIIYPADTFVGDEILLMLHLLENEIELGRTLRPPSGANSCIPHATHLHLFKAGECHNATVRSVRAGNDVKRAVSALVQVESAYRALIQTLPRLIFKLVGEGNDLGDGSVEAAQRCVCVFFDEARTLKSGFEFARVHCTRMLAVYLEIYTKRQLAMEKAWVHAQILSGGAVGLDGVPSFQSLVKEGAQRPVMYSEAYGTMTSTCELLKTLCVEEERWRAIRDMRWCFAAHTLGLWCVGDRNRGGNATGVVVMDPPPVVESVTTKEIGDAYKVMIMLVHPDKNKKESASDDACRVGAARQYMMQSRYASLRVVGCKVGSG